jgi:phosphoglycerate dehydrogenase-like enzyme
MTRIAILDDYQNAALEVTDWSSLRNRTEVMIFNDHLTDPEEIVARLSPFDVVGVMRERTPLRREILMRLPKLKLIASTGTRNGSIDLAAAAEYGIEVTHTRYDSSPTIELTWALILASASNVVTENASLRSGGWQSTLGSGLRGKTLGILGLGNVGSEVAHSTGLRNQCNRLERKLNAGTGKSHGARWVSKEELFRQSDILTIHLVLSDRTRPGGGA